MKGKGTDMHKITSCPRCKKTFPPMFPSISRRDNKTKLCSDCGTAEAFEDANFAPKYTGKKYWI